ncbi:MAG: restriction endonuclease subunit S, partial [Bacteroidales bacterium]|nr:restriction endonuclease subunit S [Bacteroidales bacterium]
MCEWKELELGKLAEIQTGPFGSQLHQEDYVPVGTPLITVKNLGENKVTYNKLDFVSDQDKERLSKFILQEGDIVFSRVGYVDRRAFITKKESGWLFSGSTLRVRVMETSTLNPKYLSYYFGQKRFKEDIKNMSVGATRPSLNTQLLEEVEIIIPPLPEQRAIASVLSSLDDKIDLLHRQNKTLEAMAETLFRQWFVEEADEGWEEGK